MTTDTSAFWADKRVLITGASGLIGSALTAEMLRQGAIVSVFMNDVDLNRPLLGDRGMLDSIYPLSRMIDQTFFGDLQRIETLLVALAHCMPEAIFHLGALTQVVDAKYIPAQTFAVNAMGTVNLLEACRMNKGVVKAIILSTSDKVYGQPWPEDLPLKETAPLRPTHPYDASKAAADLAAQMYESQYGLPIQIARLCNVYGPGDSNFERIIPGAIRAGLRNEQFTIRSDGRQIREYLYVADAVEALLHLGRRMLQGDAEIRRHGPVWNIASNDARTALDVFAAVQITMYKHTQRTMAAPLILGEAVDETPDLRIDSTKARGFLLWHPSYPMDVGLTKTISYVHAYLERRTTAVPRGETGNA